MIDRRKLMISGAALAGLAAVPARATGPFDDLVERLRGFVQDGDLPFASLRIARPAEVLVATHHPAAATIGPGARNRRRRNRPPPLFRDQ